MKARITVLLAVLVVLALAGCGSASPNTTSIKEAPRGTCTNVNECPGSYAGHETSAAEVAQAVRQERRKAAEQKAEARRAIQERGEREAEENSPESHHYPPSVRTDFLHGCEVTSGHEDSACECAIKRIEAKVPLGRYRQNEAEIRAGKPPAFIYNFEYGYCAGSEAVAAG